MKNLLVHLLIVTVAFQPLYARVERGGGGNRIAVQNHSMGINQNTNVNRNFNQSTNVNRNVNVNRNINVNNNVYVHGGYYGGCCYHEDNNWGAFAAGAAVGAVTTAAVAAASRPHETTVVTNTVAVGSIVPTLPGGCTTVASGSAVIYQCSNVYYRPYYQGSSLVYQVVTYP